MSILEKLLRERDVYDEFIKYAGDYNPKMRTEQIWKLSEKKIVSSFLFDNTPQGYEFWDNINKELIRRTKKVKTPLVNQVELIRNMEFTKGLKLKRPTPEDDITELFEKDFEKRKKYLLL